MQQDLTQGSVTKSMLLFACPMILGNIDEPTPASTTSATPRLAPELMPST